MVVFLNEPMSKQQTANDKETSQSRRSVSAKDASAMTRAAGIARQKTQRRARLTHLPLRRAGLEIVICDLTVVMLSRDL
ncbi:hypothetical protein EVAR_54018_1 [Eumeta japonica]|uniref:Uncharacterized protein n=1 Tax=Eumeta variegata TaxID=151549 RepID=A0A4C1XVA6_EUMVA|nr:hypothetical protein EVAR_54018_1 [Eumeta japonica]